MSTSKTPLERYQSFLVTEVPGRPQCIGWRGKIDRYGNATFTWTREGKHRSANAARWSWEHHRGDLEPGQALVNRCGYPACQRLGHWQPQSRFRGLTPDERHEAAIDRSGGPEACHEWGKATDKNGYGLLTWREDGKSRTQRAHRRAWEREFGSIPPGMAVLHTCDNPPCQNPRHLFLGTIADNNADMVAKGRGVYPGRPRALTPEQETKIREGFTGARGQIKTLSERYGVHRKTIERILRGRS